MATIECKRNDEGNVEVNVTARLGRVTVGSLKLAHRHLKTILPCPLDSGFPRDAGTKTNMCYVTVHGHTSNDGVIRTIKSVGSTLAPVVPIDTIDVSGMARH